MPKAQTIVDANFERSEKMDVLHDALGRAEAIILGAVQVGAMAAMSGKGVELLRRLTLETEHAIREARAAFEEVRRG